MNIKNLFFLATFFLVCEISFSQTNEVLQKKDSIIYLLKNAKGKQQLKFLKRATELSQELQIDSLIMASNNKYGLQSFFEKKKKGLDIAQKNLNSLYLKSNDSFALAKSYHYKALIFSLIFKKDSSLYYYQESKNISLLLKDSLEVGRRLLSMANLQLGGKDYLGAEVSSIEGLRFLEPINDYRYSGSLYNNLGIVAKRLKKYDEAIKYYNKSKQVHQKNPSKRRKEIGQLNYFNNVGTTYTDEGKYQKAISFFKQGLQLDSIEMKYPRSFVLLTNNLANNYLKIGEFDKAIKNLRKANTISTKSNNIKELSTNHNIQSIYYYKNKYTKKSVFHAKKALRYARKSKFLSRETTILSNISKYKLVPPNEVNAYMLRYIQINDSLLDAERTLKNQFAKIRYETGKKEKENVTLKVENEKKQLEIAQEKQQKLIGFLLATASLLILGISILVFKNRRKKLAFETQLQKAEVREHERQQIAKSLHDEVAGDLRVLHQQLEQTNQIEVAEKLDVVKNNVRNLSHQLSSVHFNEVSFKDQVINLISDYFSAKCKITINGLKENDWKAIANPIKRTLYLSTRESIQNSMKHAGATQLKIDLKKDKNNVYLTVEDNGVGFDLSEKANGIGLKNQRERIEELKGNIEIKSEINRGTTIKIEIPINAR